MYAEVIINCGVIPATKGGRADGLVTFGKHKGSYLSDEAVDRGYIAWLYALLEKAGLPEEAVGVLDLLWFWGDSKDEVEGDEELVEFDELLDGAREAMEAQAEEKERWRDSFEYVQDAVTGQFELAPYKRKR